WVSFRDDFIDNFQGTVNVGKTNGFPAPNNPSQIGLWERDGSTLGQNVDTNIDYTGEAQLMLVEFIFGVDGNDLVNLYIDEDALADPNTYIADATLSGFDMGFYSIYLNRADTRGVVYGWDEFRIGETANDVLPNAASAVPEPTTLALISLGLVGIGYRRRKHSKTAT
ncbi:MAG: PEP-CTERM sorting domain-containing protein, partial [Thiotrichaceae bacterium]|nr:PEP-CTERM sorting domain-containing protein [Thiotrichaceae bacterium]